MLFAVQYKKNSSKMDVVPCVVDEAGSDSHKAASLMQHLKQALALEAKFQSKLQLPSIAPGGVSCLKVF